MTAHFGTRPLRHVLPLLHGEGVGHPGLARSSAEWAVQRIKDFSFWRALLAVLRLQRGHVTTLIEEFHYPRLGPGPDVGAHAGSASRSAASRSGSTTARAAIRHEHDVVQRSPCESDGTTRRRAGRRGRSPASRSASWSSASTRRRPTTCVAAAQRLRYRSLCLVALDDRRRAAVPGQLDLPPRPGHARGPRAELRRLEPATWSSPGTTCLGVEYFCFEGDEIWEMSDERGASSWRPTSSRGSGWSTRRTSSTASKVRVPKAYPMYDADYREAVADPRLPGRLREPEDLRPQRAPPLQQPGPLDVDGDPRHAEPPRRRRTTTCGPSTPRPSTTRRARSWTSCSTSSSSAGPTSVHRRSASNGAPGSVERCLAALEPARSTAPR